MAILDGPVAAAAPDAVASAVPIDVLVLCCVARTGLLSLRDCVHCRLVSKAWRFVLDAVALAHGTKLLTHADCSKHCIPRRKERPERLKRILDRCLQRFPQLQCVDAFAVATRTQLERFHTDAYIEMLFRYSAKIERSMLALDLLQGKVVPDQDKQDASKTTGNGKTNGKTTNGKNKINGIVARPKTSINAAALAEFEYVELDCDTVMMRHTLNAALAAAGGVCHAIDLVMTRRTRNAFCVVRPPGHHAEPPRAMGFCFFNNVGVGAAHALHQHGIQRLAIVDFDVHHGNGTQQYVVADSRMLYVSLHQSLLFPTTGGTARECGALDNLVNVPLPAHTTSTQFRNAFRRHALPRVAAFKPELILISAGFDGHEDDPLSHMELHAADYYWLTKQLVRVAWQSCDGRVVSVLEGGYHVRSLAKCAEHHVRALIHGSLPLDVRQLHKAGSLDVGSA